MTRYVVMVSPQAEKQLAAIRDVRLNDLLTRRMMALGDDPRPPGEKKLKGRKDQWRIRVGDWRVVYVIEDGRLVVVVVAVGARGGVYG
jgi:mRNA interferase RelE/StbE